MGLLTPGARTTAFHGTSPAPSLNLDSAIHASACAPHEVALPAPALASLSLPGPHTLCAVEQRVPAGLGTLPAPNNSDHLMGARVSVARYVAVLQRDYQQTQTGYAAGVLHAAHCLALLLASNKVLAGEELCARLRRLCTEMFELYPVRSDGFNTGVVSVANDLWLALEAFPDPDLWDEVYAAIAPPEARDLAKAA